MSAAAFTAGDAVIGCFDDEAQTAMETTPHPNLIIPLQLSDPASVRRGLRILGVVCDTLAAASRLLIIWLLQQAPISWG